MSGLGKKIDALIQDLASTIDKAHEVYNEHGGGLEGAKAALEYLYSLSNIFRDLELLVKDYYSTLKAFQEILEVRQKEAEKIRRMHCHKIRALRKALQWLPSWAI